MATIKLKKIAFARSGDKGTGSNVGVVARSEAAYAIIKKYLTPPVVKEHFHKICKGPVDRYDLPNLRAVNFILHDSLGGGGSESMKTDAQGKAHGLAMLELTLKITNEEYEQLGLKK
ncbi:MAG: hypothetical protein K9N46_02760 [Candidatus Marinimicrobia bacterium]|nr:hypothetical protein [Candidatus Neomarinimicrobiota bacterium]MCF7828182.1 hypothetical protein [Candidatus Neomarinimicrobiota bacterium]MCF7879643.1 hypothetical protein [Candidatus Neomarinimicrobiota bacterium]